MVEDQTLVRLSWHAGLQEGPLEDNLSIAACTWPGNGSEADLKYAVQDFLRTLSTLNYELNGPVPSESVTKAESISRRLVYSVTESIRLLREYQEGKERGGDRCDLSRSIWRTETAWSAVLAGDIDNLEQHLEEEEQVRFG